MSPDLEPRLGDLEESEIARVEIEFARRARTARPWSITRYLDNIAAVHARYEHMRRYQTKQVAA